MKNTFTPEEAQWEVLKPSRFSNDFSNRVMARIDEASAPQRMNVRYLMIGYAATLLLLALVWVRQNNGSLSLNLENEWSSEVYIENDVWNEYGWVNEE